MLFQSIHEKPWWSRCTLPGLFLQVWTWKKHSLLFPISLMLFQMVNQTVQDQMVFEWTDVCSEGHVLCPFLSNLDQNKNISNPFNSLTVCDLCLYWFRLKSSSSVSISAWLMDILSSLAGVFQALHCVACKSNMMAEGVRLSHKFFGSSFQIPGSAEHYFSWTQNNLGRHFLLWGFLYFYSHRDKALKSVKTMMGYRDNEKKFPFNALNTSETYRKCANNTSGHSVFPVTLMTHSGINQVLYKKYYTIPLG